jgi:hypothetical protein
MPPQFRASPVERTVPAVAYDASKAEEIARLCAAARPGRLRARPGSPRAAWPKKTR